MKPCTHCMCSPQSTRLSDGLNDFSCAFQHGPFGVGRKFGFSLHGYPDVSITVGS